MKKNIVEIFFDSAEKHASKTAIVHKDDMISYEVLAKKVEATAVFLSEKGIRKGDKVLVFIPMSIQLYTTILALFSIGAMVVFVDEWSRKSRLEKAIQVVDIDTIIAPRKLIWLAYLLPAFRKIKRKFSIPKNIRSAEFSYATVEKNNTALITFTTGSTGTPKAANRTHQFLWEQFRILKDEIGATENDNCLITLPIVLLSILGTGATGYIADFNQKKPHKLNEKKQIAFAQKHKINLLIASPFFIEALANAGQNTIPTLRRILTGGAPVFPALAKLIQTSFPSSKNLIAYGSTEAEPISTLTMNALLESHVDLSKGLCVGTIHSEVRCKIIKITDQAIRIDGSDWNDLEVGAGILGEIIVTGPHVLDKYYNSEKAFKENKIIDGKLVWHRTGDSGILIDGMLYLHGRCLQLISTPERILSPFIIENQLQEIEGVQLGTLIQHDHQLIACVELKKGFAPQGIEDGLNSRKIPFDKLVILDSIPRDSRHFSKIEYGKLRKIFNHHF